MRIDRSNYEAFFLDYLDGNLKEEVRADFDLFLIENPDLAAELTEVRDAMENFVQPVDLGSGEHFIFKDELKKSGRPENAEHIDELLAKELEGDLSISERSMLDEYESSGPFVAGARRFFSKTKLNNTPLNFEGKQDLLWPDSIDISAMPYILIAKTQGDLSKMQMAHLDTALKSNPGLQRELSVYEKIKLQPENIEFADKSSLRKKEPVVITMRRAFYSFTSAAAAIALIVWFSLGDSPKPGRLANTEVRSPQVTNASGNSAPSTSGDNDNTAPVLSPQNMGISNDPELYTPAEDVAQIEKINTPAVERDSQPQNENELPSNQSPADIIRQVIEPENNDVAQNNIPDMTPVHLNNGAVLPGNQTKPRTILSLIGERVEKSVENSYAYGLVERNAEKIGSVSKNAENKIVYERISKDAQTDQVKFRFMGIGFERDVAKKQEEKKNPDSRFSRLERKYRSLISN